MATLLDIRNLETHFFTDEGVVKAGDGVSYDVQEGETLGIVGESGCGKSVGAMSVMRLIPEPPGKIVGGEVIFEGEDLLAMDIFYRNLMLQLLQLMQKYRLILEVDQFPM